MQIRFALWMLALTVVAVGCSSEPAVNATPEPAAKATSEPAVTVTSEPAVKATSEPAVKATSEPAAKATPEPAVKATSESAAKATPEPAVKATSEPAVKATPEPAVKAEAVSGRILVGGRIMVGENLNPNAEGRPSPVVLTIYQLRDKAEFAAASFDELADRDQEILGDALLGSDTLMLCPLESPQEPYSARASDCQGRVKPITLKILPTARYLGVVAGFYYLNDPSGDWRDVVEIPEEGWFGSRKFVIWLQRATVSVDFE